MAEEVTTQPTGGEQPAGGESTQLSSAAAAITAGGEPANGGEGAQPTITAGGEEGKGGEGAQPTSAAAAITAGGEKPTAGGEQPAGGEGETKDVDLAKTSDDDYAKLVQPDVDGEEVDRSLITPMAKELREAGIQPSVMAKVGEIYRKVVRAQLEADEAARASRMKEMTDKCLKELTEEEKLDFAAAYNEHIVKDEMLKHVIDHTELGSNPAFIKLIAIAGATLRGEKTPPASATAGSGQTNLERAVFEHTVPKELR